VAVRLALVPKLGNGGRADAPEGEGFAEQARISRRVGQLDGHLAPVALAASGEDAGEATMAQEAQRGGADPTASGGSGGVSPWRGHGEPAGSRRWQAGQRIAATPC
jgi:hypothetical protein